MPSSPKSPEVDCDDLCTCDHERFAHMVNETEEGYCHARGCGCKQFVNLPVPQDAFEAAMRAFAIRRAASRSLKIVNEALYGTAASRRAIEEGGGMTRVPEPMLGIAAGVLAVLGDAAAYEGSWPGFIAGCGVAIAILVLLLLRACEKGNKDQ